MNRLQKTAMLNTHARLVNFIIYFTTQCIVFEKDSPYIEKLKEIQTNLIDIQKQLENFK